MATNEARRNYLLNLDSQMVYKIVSDDPIGRDSGNIPVYKVAHSALHGTTVTFSPHDFLCVKKACNSTTLQEEILTRNNALPYHHKNLMPVDAHFVDRQSEDLCVVMPFPERGSLRSILADKFQYGFPEVLISVALRPVLKALKFLHGAKILHGDVNAGHVYVKSGPQILLGFAATVFEHRVSNLECSSHSALPATRISTWAAAPEVYNNGGNEKNKGSDIWLVGITAMELAYGGIRVPNREAFEVLIRGIIETKRLPKNYQLEVEEEEEGEKEDEKGKKIMGEIGEEKRSFSREFEKMVAECVAWDPGDRPSARALLKHEFFGRIKGLKRSTLKSHFQQVVIDMDEEKIENSDIMNYSSSSPGVNKRRLKSHISIPGRPESSDVFDDDDAALNLNFNFPTATSLEDYSDIIKEAPLKWRFFKTSKRKLFDDDDPKGRERNVKHSELLFDEYMGDDMMIEALGDNKKVDEEYFEKKKS